MKLAIIIILLLIVLGGVYVYKESSSAAQMMGSKASMPAEITPLETIDQLSATQSAMGMKTYTDPQSVYSFSYPSTYILDTTDAKNIRLYKRGEMARPQGEVTDGVILVFGASLLSNQTLENWVDTYIRQATQSGTATISQAKIGSSINGYPGFMYSLEGVSESTNYAVQKNPESSYVLTITAMVVDPNNHGYQGEVDAILKSVQLYK
jgi:hypothetical protein